MHKIRQKNNWCNSRRHKPKQKIFRTSLGGWGGEPFGYPSFSRPSFKPRQGIWKTAAPICRRICRYKWIYQYSSFMSLM